MLRYNLTLEQFNEETIEWLESGEEIVIAGLIILATRMDDVERAE